MDRIGTAGWTIPRTSAAHFPAEGTGLERYAAVLPAAEINTTFYRSHKPAIFERWANATPPHFRFAVKAPKTVTHEKRLVETNDLLRTFVAEIAPLGGKLGPVLIQLPPSLQFTDDAAHFVGGWRELYEGPTIIEARHATWFTGEAEARLVDAHIAPVSPPTPPWFPRPRGPAAGPASPISACTVRRGCTPRPIPASRSPRSLRPWPRANPGPRAGASSTIPCSERPPPTPWS